MLNLLSLIALATCARAVSNLTLADYDDSFKKNSIVPDVISTVGFTTFLDLTYGNIEVTPGLNLTKQDTATRPQFSSRAGTAGSPVGKTYVIIAVDPDAPSPQNRSSSNIIHFMGGGFKAGGRDSFILSNSTPAILDYAGPNPPVTSPAHRYVFLLYESTPQFESQTLVTSSTPRSRFNLTQFIETTKLGAPAGGTFFYVSTNGQGSPTPTPGSSAPSSLAISFPLLIAVSVLLLFY